MTTGLTTDYWKMVGVYLNCFANFVRSHFNERFKRGKLSPSDTHEEAR